MTFALKIHTLRKNAGYSQKYIAETLGIGQTSISAYENSKAIPNYEIVYKSLASLFGVPIEFLKSDKKSDSDFITEFLKKPKKVNLSKSSEVDEIVATINAKKARGVLSKDDIMKIISQITA